MEFAWWEYDLIFPMSKRRWYRVKKKKYNEAIYTRNHLHSHDYYALMSVSISHSLQMEEKSWYNGGIRTSHRTRAIKQYRYSRQTKVAAGLWVQLHAGGACGGSAYNLSSPINPSTPRVSWHVMNGDTSSPSNHSPTTWHTLKKWYS